jgi:type II secretory ATPase GspE/PulE/Tfp pilus assembly ATPase PilB-like protein
MTSNMGRAQTSTQHEPTIVQGVQQIIERAAKNGVSDVHIEPTGRFVRVRYRRRGGPLYTANKLPKDVAIPLARYIKAAARLDVSQTKAPQIGQYELSIGRQKYDLEVGTLPVLDGERITVKINEKMATKLDLESLGLWGSSLSKVEQVLTQPRGLIVVAGRQGNHVTNTLVAMLQLFDASGIKLGFISNEGTILSTNAKQLTVRSDSTLNSTQQLELLLRDNFTVIGINTLIDHPTIKAAVEAVHSKHLIITGITADNAIRGIKLLQQVSRTHLTASTLSLAVGQVFVRRLCEHCREAYEPLAMEQAKLAKIFHIDKASAMKHLHELEKSAVAAGLNSKQPISSNEKSIHKLWRPNLNGCKYCDHTGYMSDIGVFEVCQPSDRLRKQLVGNEPTANLQKTAIIDDGMISLRVDGLIKALRGMIDLPTLLSICATTV